MEARYNFRKPKGERDDAQLHQELKAQNLPVLMVLSGEANPRRYPCGVRQGPDNHRAGAQ
jgi:hypothetical protein